MKKQFLSLFVFCFTSFLLSGLQSNLYFLPIPLPAFWFIILCYYSFNKRLVFSLACNLVHTFVLISFSSIPISFLLIFMNLFTMSFITIRERFRTNSFHIALASGCGYFIFQSIQWTLQIINHGVFPPNLLTWFGSSALTTLCAPAIIFILSTIDEKIHLERVDTLENLRI